MSRRPPSHPTAPRSASAGGPHIRAASADDAPVIIDFQTRMALETENLDLDLGAVGRGVRAIFDDPSLGEYWVAELDGHIAGCMLVTREWSDWRNGTVLWIQSVYTHPESRRRGVYRALYDHLQRRVAAAPDILGIRLYVEVNNQPAHRTYADLGMRGDHYVVYEWMK
jgi:ribosomal protein S18 acetylase RimI-like enzyme